MLFNNTTATGDVPVMFLKVDGSEDFHGSRERLREGIDVPLMQYLRKKKKWSKVFHSKKSYELK